MFAFKIFLYRALYKQHPQFVSKKQMAVNVTEKSSRARF